MTRAALFVAVLAAASSLSARDLYVAPTGDDANPGSLEKPFATLERARDAARAIKSEPVTIWLRGGVYFRERTLALTAADSGTESTPVIWRAWPGETVRWTGGRRISDFKAAGGKLLRCDLAAQGITDYGKLQARGFGRANLAAALELFFNGSPMTLARWPNRGWARVAAAPDGQKGARFTMEEDRAKRWEDAPDVWVHGYWTYDWADSYESVERIDAAAHALTTRAPHGVYGYTAGRRWRALNLLEELDEAGEYYVDRTRGILYFWPPSPVEGAEALVSMLATPLVSFTNVSHVTLRDLTLEVTRGDAITLSGGTHVTIAGCRIRNIGNAAIRVNSGVEHTVQSCDISETGDGGIFLAGGDRSKLTPAGHTAVNNHIWNFSRWDRTYRPAVTVAGVGQRVLRNLIHDAPHMAIGLSGNDHLIEGNDIHSMTTETFDAGAFYMGRDWTWRGNIVQYNAFRNLGDGDTNGVYLDDCASGTLVFANLFHRASRAVHLGGGRDNTILNNVFIECQPPIKVDARALGWANKWITGEDMTLYDRLKAMPYKEPPWSDRYPQLVNILDDEPGVPKGNRIARNIFWRGIPVQLRDNTAKWVAMEDNFEGDPGFTSASGFVLSDDSPARRLGIEPLPVAIIGLYADEHRPAPPDPPVVHWQLTAPSLSAVAIKVENLGRAAASGEFELWVSPEGAAKVVAEGGSSYALNPGEETTLRYRLEAAEGIATLTVGAQRKGDVVMPAGVLIRLSQ